MIDIWLKVPWTKEASDLEIDPTSGAEITQLSGSSRHTCNNYLFGSCSAAGSRCLGVRLADALTTTPCELVVHDLVSKHTALLEQACSTIEQVTVPFSGLIYYINDRRELCRVSLDTFRKEIVLPMQGLPAVADVLRTLSRDGRYLYYTTVMNDSAGLTLGLVRVDLSDESWSIVFTSSGLHGVQYLAGIDVLLIGQRTLRDGSMPPLGIWSNGPNLSYSTVMLKPDGTIMRKLDLPPGYPAWLPHTGEMVCNQQFDTEHWRHLPERPTGNMVVYRSLEWDEPRVIEAPDHLMFHAARSHCNHYVVSEAYRVGRGIQSPLDIVVVNIQTGKYRVLVADCGTKPHGAAWRTCCPYLTSDNSFVVYNADRYDLTHVHAARVPAGFLTSLD
jgi:hypothetical protein